LPTPCFRRFLHFYNIFIPAFVHGMVFVKLGRCNTKLFGIKSKLYLMCIYKILFIEK